MPDNILIKILMNVKIASLNVKLVLIILFVLYVLVIEKALLRFI